MGQTPSFNDRFNRQGTPAKTGPSGGHDRFAGTGAPAGKVDHFGKSGGGAKGDAFASGRAAKAAPVDKFGGKAATVRTDGFAGPAAAAVIAPPPAPPPVKKTELRVVAKRPEPEVIAAAAEPLEVRYQDLKREEAWRRKAAKSSSLVLVSGAPGTGSGRTPRAPPPSSPAGGWPARARPRAAPAPSP